MSPFLASGGSTDVVARVIAALGLGIAIVAIGVNWLIWHRSRPSLKVRLRAETDPDPMRGGLVIEVVSVGRLAVVVKSLGLRDRSVLGNAVTTLLSMPVEPSSADLPLTLEPTEYLEAEVGWKRSSRGGTSTRSWRSSLGLRLAMARSSSRGP